MERLSEFCYLSATLKQGQIIHYQDLWHLSSFQPIKDNPSVVRKAQYIPKKKTKKRPKKPIVYYDVEFVGALIRVSSWKNLDRTWIGHGSSLFHQYTIFDLTDGVPNFEGRAVQGLLVKFRGQLWGDMRGPKNKLLLKISGHCPLNHLSNVELQFSSREPAHITPLG